MVGDFLPAFDAIQTQVEAVGAHLLLGIRRGQMAQMLDDGSLAALQIGNPAQDFIQPVFDAILPDLKFFQVGVSGFPHRSSGLPS